MAVPVLLNPKAPEFQMPSASSSSFKAFDPNAPEFKPVEPSLTLRREAAEFIPMQGGWATVAAVAEAYQNKQKRQMPWASDEEWEQRIAKREKEVDTIKSLQSYRLYIEVFPHDKRGDDDPKTPDPTDRTVSKRMWKWNVEKWRLQLKSRCVYSRAVLLQCYAEIRRRETTPEAPDTSAAEASSELPAGETAASGQAEAMAPEPHRLPKAFALPDQQHTVPSGSRKAGAEKASDRPKGKPSAATGAGTYQ